MDLKCVDSFSITNLKVGWHKHRQCLLVRLSRVTEESRTGKGIYYLLEFFSNTWLTNDEVRLVWVPSAKVTCRDIEVGISDPL